MSVDEPFFGGQYCKQYGPRSDCLGFIVFASVNFLAGIHLNICSRCNKLIPFSGQIKLWRDKG